MGPLIFGNPHLAFQGSNQLKPLGQGFSMRLGTVGSYRWVLEGAFTGGHLS